ncbi:MAG: ligase-associated DNA damage response exonuclease [Bdellovibrionota bacterium]
MDKDLIQLTDKGLYCAEGDFFVDPWRPTPSAFITHVHGDHAHSGHEIYYCSEESAPLLKHRIPDAKEIKPIKYSEKLKIGNCWVSFHPAGHILGSSQIRVEYKNSVWVVSGDYKRTPDPSCKKFEVIECDTFITESTFGLPIYHWPDTEVTAREILEWVNQHEGPSILFCYSLGKAQRVLAELAKISNETVYLHGATMGLTQIYRDLGIKMVPTTSYLDLTQKDQKCLILAPPSAHRSPWMKRFKNFQTGFASGWMAIRGNKRRRNVEKGFILSDHADWNELIQTITETKAKRVLVTHGFSDILAQYLTENMGLQGETLQTQFEGETASE